MRKNWLYLPVAAIAAGALVAIAVPAVADKQPPKPAARVAIKDNFFSKRSVTIAEGETVKWVWRGENRHNVAFTRVPEGASRRGSRTRRKGRWFKTFRKPGQYRYVCTLFAGMRGSVTVEPEGSSSLDAASPSAPADLAAGARP
jgi:plastocyanin